MTPPNRPVVAVHISTALRERLFGRDAWERVRELAEVQTIDMEAHSATVPDRDTVVLVTGWDTPPLTRANVADMPHLGLIAHTGGSIRTLVPESAFSRGVAVTQVANVLAEGVAEFAVLAVLEGLRELGAAHRQLAADAPWEVVRQPGRLLLGATVGIVGASRTGRATLQRLKPFGCHLRICDPYLSTREAEDLGAELVGLEELLGICDVVSLHAPLLSSTRHMIGAAELQHLQDGALLVNTARADLVDEQAAYSELSSGRLRAVLDVFWTEPLPVGDRWRHLPNVLVAPHVAALTHETLRHQGQVAVEEVLRFLTGTPLQGAVDPAHRNQLA